MTKPGEKDEARHFVPFYSVRVGSYDMRRCFMLNDLTFCELKEKEVVNVVDG